MDKKYSGKSNYKRNSIIDGIDELSTRLPFKIGRPSQLRVLTGACAYLKKNEHFSKLKRSIDYKNFPFAQNYDNLRNVLKDF
jgi:hypothetical protein